ncbi:hypothetical protein DB44_GT00050 [Candidatus Protochlamydia amoebophila]|uniref:Uncharacterized protein n=1 Tax=Candidatus Protochlamydia amoebophila TaxID=362787 RepID=A0A0C1JJC4_9BACT|nr:hypothetical protein DB44_GT00050 [Candidatus Protochlamydia amoebophila]
MRIRFLIVDSFLMHIGVFICQLFSQCTSGFLFVNSFPNAHQVFYLSTLFPNALGFLFGFALLTSTLLFRKENSYTPEFLIASVQPKHHQHQPLHDLQ